MKLEKSSHYFIVQSAIHSKSFTILCASNSHTNPKETVIDLNVDSCKATVHRKKNEIKPHLI